MMKNVRFLHGGLDRCLKGMGRIARSRDWVRACCAISIVWVFLGFPLQGVAGLPAFLGAEGSGAFSKGGRGGVVCEVKNLNDSGPGSLRACAEMSGPRTVIFRVSGTIVLESRIRIRHPYITIAGQTAPGGGIQLAGKIPGSIPDDGCPFPYDARFPGSCPEGQTPGPAAKMRHALIWVETNDVIIRYLRLRTGYVGYCSTCPGTGWAEPLLIGNMSGLSSRSHVENIVIDHVSAMWGSNHNLRIWDLTGGRRVGNISVQNSIFAETLYGRNGVLVGASKNETYPIAGDEMRNIDFHRNFLGTNFSRTPVVAADQVRWVNNISYNTRSTLVRVGGNEKDNAYDIDFIGNIFDHGPLHRSSSRGFYEIGVPVNEEFPARVYVSGNRGDRHGYDDYEMVALVSSAGARDSSASVAPAKYRRSGPLPQSGIPVATLHVDELESAILPTIGASRRLDCEGNWIFNRDATDIRLIEEAYRSRAQGTFVMHEDQVGGFPLLEKGQPCADSSGDGIPDAWLIRNGMNPEEAIGSRFHDSGYTFLELYLNGIHVNDQPHLAPASAPSGVLVQ